jgi:plastocyanin
MPATSRVAIRQFAFQPAELRVTLGDTVEWKNDDILPHVVASDSTAWKSGELAVAASYSFVPTRRGRFPYHCDAHPSMRGLLVVN